MMQLNHSKSEMSAFQMQTNYLKFLHKRDIKVLSDSVISCNKSDSLYSLCQTLEGVLLHTSMRVQTL